MHFDDCDWIIGEWFFDTSAHSLRRMSDGHIEDLEKLHWRFLGFLLEHRENPSRYEKDELINFVWQTPRNSVSNARPSQVKGDLIEKFRDEKYILNSPYRFGPIRIEPVPLPYAIPKQQTGAVEDPEVPPAPLPRRRRFVVAAALVLVLGAVATFLFWSRSASVHGQLVDDGDHAISGIRIGIAGRPTEAVTTGKLGEFTFPAHARSGDLIRLRVYDDSLVPVTEFYYAGEEPIQVRVSRKNGPDR